MMRNRHRPATLDASCAGAQDVQGRSLWVDARRRLFRNRAAVSSMVVLALIALMAIFAPLAVALRL